MFLNLERCYFVTATTVILFVCLFYLLQPKQAAMRDEVEILKKLHHVIIIFLLLLFSLKPLNSTFNLLCRHRFCPSLTVKLND